MSVLLPKTSFSMKGQLPKQEPALLAWWGIIDIYKNQKRTDRPLFVLHNGPPYANGPIHLGHALNYILKDFVNRFKLMQGYTISFVPGWDCHGLPIEAKIEEKHIKNKTLNTVSVPEFRKECRDYAAYWIEQQKQDFQRLGVLGDWDNSYTTMNSVFESKILNNLFAMVGKGYVYRGIRPVLWSASEKTALAEAEVEYQEVTSKAIYVRFPLIGNLLPEFQNTSLVIWTTTPWSLPGNRAICYSTCADYVLYQVTEVSPGSLINEGEKIILSKDRLDPFCNDVGIVSGIALTIFQGANLQDMEARHPWFKEGYNFKVHLLPSEFVTTDSGTGLVHTAPGHGLEDFIIGQRYQLEISSPISESGIFFDDVIIVGGMHMYKAYDKIREELIRYNALAGESDYRHSYPHSWRSKKPLFYRATPQWFIALDGLQHLRQKALAAIKEVKWYPASSQNRIEAMVSGRPDWCISRQRVWGVPIAEFFNVHTGAPLNDMEVHKRIEDLAAKDGVDFWFTDEAWSVLGDNYNRNDWVKGQDIIDVWFESGVTHEIVLKPNADAIDNADSLLTKWPASLYLEGSDQHRGWFQSSLLTSVALENGKPPFEAVLTHGFILDERGKKMSKSLGNVISPQDIIKEKGADILRLWVAYEDYQKDLRVGPSIIARVEDLYRRFRNTFRYCLGALNEFNHNERIPVEDLPLLERWIHHRIYEVNQTITNYLENYDFRAIVNQIHLFCSQDLSSFYFDVCKDSLYCDAISSKKRQGIRTTFFHALWFLIHWLSPVLCFTAEEVWSCLGKDILGLDPNKPLDSQSSAILDSLEQSNLWKPTKYWSIHLSEIPQVPQSWCYPSDKIVVGQLRMIRSVVTSALEKAREKKEIGSSLQAAPVVRLSSELKSLPTELLPDICLTSALEVQWDSNAATAASDIDVQICLAFGEKCDRCWRVLEEVEDALCLRCAAIVQNIALPDDLPLNFT